MNRNASMVIILMILVGGQLEADVFKMPSGLRSLETVVVGNPGNPAGDNGFGAVAYPFKIGKYEVTTAQYVEFLNAKAQNDQYALFSDNMYEEDPGCKIQRHGTAGSYTYSVAADRANRPVSLVSFWSACRFVNWLHNGQGDGDTETGAYTLNGYKGDDGGAIRRNPDAKWFIPSEDEWHKAAYYDPQKKGGAGYWDFPTRSDAIPSRDINAVNSANYYKDGYLDAVYLRTEVGAFSQAGSAYGTFDQGGNVSEWVEDTQNGPYRCLRGGSYLLGTDDLQVSCRDYHAPGNSGRGDNIGFRVAGALTDAQGRLIPAKGASRKQDAPTKPDAWAKPGELWGKIMIGTGQDSLGGISPQFLVNNLDFIAHYPYDGVATIVPLAADWIAAQGFSGAGTYDTLDVLVWSKVEVPYSAVKRTVESLQRVSWRQLTDNFLWCRFNRTHTHNPDRDFAANFTKDEEWAAVEKNIALMARVCREAKFKGIMLDTEQYGRYVSGEPYPMGKDTAEVLRKRGRQWIQAIQAEYPAVTIIIFFGWSPDLNIAGFLKGVEPFLNGVLEGIQAPGRLVHAYENTFYYGMGPCERFSAEGFPGDRARYQWARDSMKKWRCFSSDPAKFEKFVDVGMAAWMESDPWDVAPDASGGNDMVWSNVPLALAYSDRYVWVWSEHTDYANSFLRGNDPNPYLLSLSNQTFNTGHEAAYLLAEDFATNPLLKGWYFDFDILKVGRKKAPSQISPILSLEAVPYFWSRDSRAVQIQGTWTEGPSGEEVARLGQQRRRYVHPLQPLTQNDVFQVEFDFQVDRFGSDPANPIVLGLFNSDAPVNRQALTLQIKGPEEATITLVGEGKPWVAPLPVKGGLAKDTAYRLAVAYDGPARSLQIKLIAQADSSLLNETQGTVPASTGQFSLDELGAAQWDVTETSTPVAKAYQYRLQRVKLARK
jgi:formylglycine-generating enzyme